MKAITIRNVPPELAAALDREKRRRGQSSIAPRSTCSSRAWGSEPAVPMAWASSPVRGARSAPGSSIACSPRSETSIPRCGSEPLLSRHFGLHPVPAGRLTGCRRDRRGKLDRFPVIALGELYTGFLLSGQQDAETERLRDFREHPVVETIPVDDEVVHEYGHLVAELRKAGKPVPANDVWIAACAARTSSVVLTTDSRFTWITPVGCVLLQQHR